MLCSIYPRSAEYTLLAGECAVAAMFGQKVISAAAQKAPGGPRKRASLWYDAGFSRGAIWCRVTASWG